MKLLLQLKLLPLLKLSWESIVRRSSWALWYRYLPARELGVQPEAEAARARGGGVMTPRAHPAAAPPRLCKTWG